MFGKLKNDLPPFSAHPVNEACTDATMIVGHVMWDFKTKTIIDEIKNIRIHTKYRQMAFQWARWPCGRVF